MGGTLAHQRHVAHEIRHFAHIYGHEALNLSLVLFRQTAECIFNDVNWPFCKEFRHVEVDQGPVPFPGGDELHYCLNVLSDSALMFLFKTYVAITKEQIVLNVVLIST